MERDECMRDPAPTEQSLHFPQGTPLGLGQRGIADGAAGEADSCQQAKGPPVAEAAKHRVERRVDDSPSQEGER